MTLKEKDNTNHVTSKYGKWKGLLGVLVLMAAVFYPFKMFCE